MHFISRAADAMSAYQSNLDVIGQNLANLDTGGYRARRTSFVESAHGSVRATQEVPERMGALQSTQVPTDLAIDGVGHFVIQGTDGRMYTRNGSFHRDTQGNLLFSSRNLAVLGYGVDAQGNVDHASGLVPLSIPTQRTVQGSSGTTTDALSSFTVAADGTVTGTYASGSTVVVGQLALARFADEAGLKQGGDNLLEETATSGSAQLGVASQGGFGAVDQGSLEGSNTDVTVEYARMMLSQRAYQANSQLMRVGDEMWQQLMAVHQ